MTGKTAALCLAVLAATVIPSAPAGAQVATVWNHPGLGVESIYPTGDRCGTVAAGDFDGDGDTDLAVATYPGTPPESAQLRLWWNDGRAQFDNRSAPIVNHPFATFCPIDVGADGVLDLAVADSAAGLGIEIVRGLGGGAFASPVAVAPSLRCALLAVADMNRDGRQDLIGATCAQPFGIVVLLQNEQGTFVQTGSMDTGAGASALATGDFDGDGFPDVASVAGSTGQVFRGDGGGGLSAWGAFTYAQQLPAGGITTLVPSDLDGDGRLDLLSGWVRLSSS